MKFLLRLLSSIERSQILRLFGVNEARVHGFQDRAFLQSAASVKDKLDTIWFHASSMGELEMLRPLISDLNNSGQKVGVSVFSASALKGITELSAEGIRVCLSPTEEDWILLLSRFQVKTVVLAKYDFWPGLLYACSVRNTPVVIVNAEVRSSLNWMKRLFKFFAEPFPRVFAFCSYGQAENVKSAYPDFTVESSADPRQERILRRIENRNENPRWSECFNELDRLTRPLGILGSVWLQDLDVLRPTLKKCLGSIAVFPHDLSETNVQAIRAFFKDLGFAEERVLIVSKMGVLTEAYGIADWAYVGGGFGRGIHSVLEPILNGCPTSVGPKNFFKFPEAIYLAGCGLLTEVKSSDEFMAWHKTQAQDRARIQEWVNASKQGLRKLYQDLLAVIVGLR